MINENIKKAIKEESFEKDSVGFVKNFNKDICVTIEVLVDDVDDFVKSLGIYSELSKLDSTQTTLAINIVYNALESFPEDKEIKGIW